LGRLSEVIGEDDDAMSEYQLRAGQSIISAYQLPTEIGRYDTTSFNVYHHPENGKNGMLEFGHSKNHRSDLLQFKQGLATLDPAGVPILSETFAGNRADDPCYLPAWRRIVKTIGKPDFLFIADCKAASYETRAAIDHGKGCYLFPLPMTGETPGHIEAFVLNPEQELQDIVLAPRQDQDDEDRVVGKGLSWIGRWRHGLKTALTINGESDGWSAEAMLMQSVEKNRSKSVWRKPRTNSPS
jgi:transposase